MKKTIAIVACAAAMLLAGKANAQLGINVGYAPVTLTKATTYNGETSTTSSEMDGFFGGVTYNYGLNKGIGLAFGLQGRYNTKTSTKSDDFYVISGNQERTTTQFLLDVPVLLNYSFDLNRSAKLKVFAGPTFSYALKGNTHVTTTNSAIIVGSHTDEDDYDMIRYPRAIKPVGGVFYNSTLPAGFRGAVTIIPPHNIFPQAALLG